MATTLVYEKARPISSTAQGVAERVLGGLPITKFEMRGKKTLVVTVDPAQGDGFTVRLKSALSGADDEFRDLFDAVDFS